jgi:nucleotide-binding universal stress UspA family protein
MKAIVVPLDCSAASERVLAAARELAEKFEAEIHLIHVHEIRAGLPAYPGTAGGVTMSEMMPIAGVPVGAPIDLIRPTPADDEQRRQLPAWKDELSRAGLKVILHEPSGSVVEQILEQADRAHAGMIVMGSHGHGAMYNLLVGSVTAGVLKGSKCPVLLVPADQSGSGD